LSKDEVDTLNRLVVIFLEQAEALAADAEDIKALEEIEKMRKSEAEE